MGGLTEDEGYTQQEVNAAISRHADSQAKDRKPRFNLRFPNEEKGEYFFRLWVRPKTMKKSSTEEPDGPKRGQPLLLALRDQVAEDDSLSPSPGSVAEDTRQLPELESQTRTRSRSPFTRTGLQRKTVSGFSNDQELEIERFRARHGGLLCGEVRELLVGPTLSPELRRLIIHRFHPRDAGNEVATCFKYVNSCTCTQGSRGGVRVHTISVWMSALRV